jgi:hypothetical protein
MWRLAGALSIVAAALAPAAARACSSAIAETALIHNSVASDPDPLLVIARVNIEGVDPAPLHKAGLSARVLRMVQGSYDGELLILRAYGSTCSNPFRNGTSGLVVGIPLGFEKGVLVLDALPVNEVGGYRLPDRYRVPRAYLESLQRDPAR